MISLKVWGVCMSSWNHMALAMGAPVVHRVAELPSMALVAVDPACDTDAVGTHPVRDRAVSVVPAGVVALASLKARTRLSLTASTK